MTQLDFEIIVEQQDRGLIVVCFVLLDVILLLREIVKYSNNDFVTYVLKIYFKNADTSKTVF